MGLPLSDQEVEYAYVKEMLIQPNILVRKPRPEDKEYYTRIAFTVELRNANKDLLDEQMVHFDLDHVSQMMTMEEIHRVIVESLTGWVADIKLRFSGYQ